MVHIKNLKKEKKKSDILNVDQNFATYSTCCLFFATYLCLFEPLFSLSILYLPFLSFHVLFHPVTKVGELAARIGSMYTSAHSSCEHILE